MTDLPADVPADLRADLPLDAGDTLVPAQISPCVGGLLRTWTESGDRLWSVAHDAALLAVQGTGVLARSPRGQQRYRETALLHEASGTLVLSPRFFDQSSPQEQSFRSTALQLADPGPARDSAPEDFARVINQAVRHVAATFEYLVIEVGGWEAPLEPYAFFALRVDEAGRQLATIEAAPPPRGSELWQPHIQRGAPGVSVSAPVSDAAVDGATFYLADAVAGLDLLPWDVALTFGVRPTE